MMAAVVVRRRGRPSRLFLLTGLIVALIGVSLYLTEREAPWAVAVEGGTLAWRFQIRGPLPPPADIAILAIDDRAVAAAGQWPVPRAMLADMVDRLRAAGADVLAFDLMLTERGPANNGAALSPGDARLAAVLAANPRAVLPFAFTFRSEDSAPTRQAGAQRIDHTALRVIETPAGHSRQLSLSPSGVLVPFAPLPDDLAMGHVNVVLDRDGALRFLHAVIPFGDRLFPALPVEAVRLHRNLDRNAVAVAFGKGVRMGDALFPADADMRLALNYYGPERHFPTWSLAALMQGELKPESLRGKLVLIGAAATGVGDTFTTPFSRILPGVEVFATASANLLDRRFLERSDRTALVDLAAILVGVLLVTIAAHWRSPALASLGAAVTLALWLVLAQLLFDATNWWLSATFPAFSIMLATLSLGLVRILRDNRNLRRARLRARNLARYIPPRLVDELARSATPPMDERRQPAALMFIDMRDFTALNAALGAEATVALLRQFHARIETIVLAHGGTVDRFIGDGAMVIFGLPEPAPDDAARAIACARALVADIDRWRQVRVARGEAGIRIGIGLNYGPVIVANLGGQQQRQFTATGDAVNIASRLQTLARDFGVAIVASEAVVQAAAAPELLDGAVQQPPQIIRGAVAPLTVWTWPQPSAD